MNPLPALDGFYKIVSIDISPAPGAFATPAAGLHWDRLRIQHADVLVDVHGMYGVPKGRTMVPMYDCRLIGKGHFARLGALMVWNRKLMLCTLRSDGAVKFSAGTLEMGGQGAHDSADKPGAAFAAHIVARKVAELDGRRILVSPDRDKKRLTGH